MLAAHRPSATILLNRGCWSATETGGRRLSPKPNVTIVYGNRAALCFPGSPAKGGDSNAVGRINWAAPVEAQFPSNRWAFRVTRHVGNVTSPGKRQTLTYDSGKSGNLTAYLRC